MHVSSAPFPWLWLLAVSLWPASVASARALERFGNQLSFAGTNTFEYTCHLDNDRSDDPSRGGDDDHYHQVFDSVDLSLTLGDVRLSGRLDLYVYASSPFDDHCTGQAGEPGWCNQQGSRYVDQLLLYRERKAIMPEKLSLEISRPELDLTLGDFYVSFGRGLSLNVVKLDDLGQDTTVRGGKLKLHHADLGLTFAAGEINPVSIDNATGRLAPWNPEPLVAGEVEYRFASAVLAGVHGVLLITDDGLQGLCSKRSPDDTVPSSCDRARTDHDVVWGARIEAAELLGGRLSVAGELDVQRSVHLGQVVRGPDHAEGGLLIADRGNGVAAYAAAALQLGDLNLLVEVKHYDDFLLKAPESPFEPYQLLYHQPPTLERIKSEVTDNRTTTGVRLRADYSIGDDLLLFANFGLFDTRFAGDHQVHDPFVGLEWSWNEGQGRLSVTSGARYERDQRAGNLYRLDVHVEADIEQALWSTHSVKLAAYLQHRRKRLGEIVRWVELDSALEYKWSPYLSASWTVELQSDPALVSRDGAEIYLGGSVRYFFTPSSFVSLRVGENRGGIKCLNGACRRFPPFSGLQLSATARW